MSRANPLAVASAALGASIAPLLLGGTAATAPATATTCAERWPGCGPSWLQGWGSGSFLVDLYLAAVLAVVAAFAATAWVVWRQSAPGQGTKRSSGAALVFSLSLPLLSWLALADDGSAWLAALLAVAEYGLVALAVAVVCNLWRLRASATDARPRPRPIGSLAHHRALTFAAAIAVVAALAMVATGAATATVAAHGCSDWPRCRGDDLLLADSSTATWLHAAHRVSTAFGAVASLILALLARRPTTPVAVRRLSTWVIAVGAVQVLAGGNVVVARGSVGFDLLHLIAGLVLWVLLAATLAVASHATRQVHHASGTSGVFVRAGSRGARSPESPPVPSAAVAATAATGALAPDALAFPTLRFPTLARVQAIGRDYLSLTKPGILVLLLTTTVCAMLIAAPRVISLPLIALTLLGGTLAAGGANALNCFIDRDIDAIMTRTRHRATAAGRISPRAVLLFGLALSTLAVVELGLLVNWLAAGLALAGNLFYVLIYTRWLKRSTPHNIVIGGAAGAVPPLVGWAAATGEVSAVAWVLFAIIFAWTPPHFWALALLKQGEYGRAAVPMLPVVAGEAATRRQIVFYSVVLCAVCLALVPLGLGPIYLISALALNAWFLGLALHLWFRPSKQLARRLFFYSLWFLALIFAAAVVDRLVLA